LSKSTIERKRQGYGLGGKKCVTASTRTGMVLLHISGEGPTLRRQSVLSQQRMALLPQALAQFLKK